MKTTASIASVATLLCLSMGQAEFARADEDVRGNPVDVYISGFGGYSFPLKTNLESGGVEIRHAKLDSSPTFGAKIGMWFAGPRKTLGLDFGTEIDAGVFSPDIAGGQILTSNIGPLFRTNSINLNAGYFGVNILARYPMGVTPELPNGRWFPYLGVGGGVLHLALEVPGTTTKGDNTAPAFQGIGGVKVFLAKHIAAFAEGKFIHSSISIKLQGSNSIDLTVNSLHGVGGLSIHF